MTNFEIAVGRDLPLNDGQAGIIFHFLSFVGVVSFVQHTGSEGTWDSFARVSQMLDCSNSAEQGSLSFANCLFRKSFRTGRFLSKSESRMFGLDYSEIEFKLQVHGYKEVGRRELRWLVQLMFLLESLHTLWDCGSARRMYILSILEYLQNHRPCPEWCCSTYQFPPCARTMRVRKLSQVDWF